MADSLEQQVATRLGQLTPGFTGITGMRRLSGGASRDTWLVESAEQAVILRCDPQAAPRPEVMAREAAAYRVARRANLPVPTVLDAGDGSGVIKTPYLLMERLTGETIPRRLLRDARFAGIRSELPRRLGRLLAQVHAMPLGELPELEGGDPLVRLSKVYDESGEPRPAIELGLRWLAEHRPPAAQDHVVHGDFRNGNLMIDETGVRGILDWELVHRGDPVEDLGYLCVKAWRFGSAEPVGGFGAREELLAGYREVAGWCPDKSSLHWWEVYGTVRWAILCQWQAHRHLSGVEPSLELAVLGRRVAEQEHDILLALGHTSPRQVVDPLTDATSRPARAQPHDRPDAYHLIEQAAQFLTSEVVASAEEPLRYRARIATNALRIAQREMQLAGEQGPAHRRRLAGLGCHDETGLAQAIRAGSLDDRLDEVVRVVRETVTDKLLVANPPYLAQPA